MLLMDDSLEGIKNPFDYHYVKIVRFFLKTICYWPSELLGEKTWKIAQYRGFIIIFMNMVTLTSNMAYMVAEHHSLNMLEFGHMCLTMFMTTCAVARSSLLPLNPKYKKILVTYFTSLHLFHHYHKSDYSKKMHVRIHKYCHLVTLVTVVQMLVGLTLFNAIPIYLNFAKGYYNERYLVNSTYDLAVYLYMPRDATTNRNSYFIALLYNWYATYVCSCCICSTDLMLFLIIFHLYGHFKILLNLLATFPRPATVNELSNKIEHSQMFSNSELKEVFLKLKECIDYHNFLLDFIRTMSDAFGPMLFVYFWFHQVSCCLLLLECAQMSPEALMRYGPLTFIVFEVLMQISVIFEMIGTVSEKLKDAVYELPWECMDLKNRRVVLFFLMNVQTPVHVKAMGLTPVGVQTMATIIKTSLSYFAFLRTVPAE